MAKVILRREAINDLTDIWDYTVQEWSENQADKYYESIKFSCNEIGKNPQYWKKLSRNKQTIIGLKSGKHIIFYHQISANEIDIIRILHERMDLKNKLNE